jgi:polyhydroxyalkanoate synthesis regulator phasin
MPAKRKKTTSRRPRTRTRTRTKLSRTWADTRAALTSVEAAVEKQVRALVKRSGWDTKEAAKAVREWTGRVDRERRKATRRLEARLSVLQDRIRKERRGLARGVDDAVRRTLASLNIPSRAEVRELTKRVEELSRRVDRRRRR